MNNDLNTLIGDIDLPPASDSYYSDEGDDDDDDDSSYQPNEEDEVDEDLLPDFDFWDDEVPPFHNGNVHNNAAAHFCNNNKQYSYSLRPRPPVVVVPPPVPDTVPTVQAVHEQPPTINETRRWSGDGASIYRQILDCGTIVSSDGTAIDRHRLEGLVEFCERHKADDIWDGLRFLTDTLLFWTDSELIRGDALPIWFQIWCEECCDQETAAILRSFVSPAMPWYKELWKRMLLEYQSCCVWLSSELESSSGAMLVSVLLLLVKWIGDLHRAASSNLGSLVGLNDPIDEQAVVFPLEHE